jgi:beta-lactamase class A
MPRFQTQMSGNASAVVRRARRKRLAAAFAGLAVLSLASCGPPQPPSVADRPMPRIDGAGLNLAIEALAARAAPAVLGAAVLDLQTGESWSHNGDHPFPMAGLAGLPIIAAALAERDAGRLDVAQTIEIADMDLSPPPSPVARAWPARRRYSLDELIAAAVAGDTTATDVVMRRVGGPGAVGGWLQSRRLDDIRVDRYARQVGSEMCGLASFRAAWAGEPAFAAAVAAVPEPQRQAAQVEYLRERQDTATPRGVLALLGQLDRGELLSQESATRLLTLMSRPSAGPERLRYGFPPGTRIAHAVGIARTDLGVEPAANEAGIVVLPDGRRYAVAVFLAGSTLGPHARDALFIDVGKAIAEHLG